MFNPIDENDEKKIRPDRSVYFSRLLLLFSMFFLGYALSILGGLKIVSAVYNVFLNLNNLGEFLKNPSHPDAVIFIQNLNIVLCFGLPALVFLQFHAKEDMYLYMGIKPINSPRFSYIVVILAAIMLLPIIDWLSELNQLIPGLTTSPERKQEIKSMVDIFLSGTSIRDLFFNLLSVALIPAICEELFFRASLQNLIRDWTKNKYIAIAIAATVFSLLHGDMSGFIPRLAAGMILGFIYFMTNNIGMAILFHFSFNAASVLLQWCANNHIISLSSDSTLPLYIAIPAALLCAASILYLYKINRNTFHEVE